jgi:hypothetical protein
MLKNSVFFLTKRFLHDRKLPSVIERQITNIYCNKLIGTQSPRKADYCKENKKNKKKVQKENIENI